MRSLVGILMSLFILVPLAARVPAASSKVPIKEERAGLLARAKVAPAAAEARRSTQRPRRRPRAIDGLILDRGEGPAGL